MPQAKKALPSGHLLAVSNRGVVHGGMEDDAMRAGTDIVTGKARMWVIDWCVASKPKCVRIDVSDGKTEWLGMEIDHAPFRPLPPDSVASAHGIGCIAAELRRTTLSGAKHSKFSTRVSGEAVFVKIIGGSEFKIADATVNSIVVRGADNDWRPTWIFGIAPPPQSIDDSPEVVFTVVCDAKTLKATIVE